MTDTNSEHYLTYQEVARYVQLSVITIKRYVQNVEIPHLKINKSVRFSKSDIDTWLNSKKKFPKLQSE